MAMDMNVIHKKVIIEGLRGFSTNSQARKEGKEIAEKLTTDFPDKDNYYNISGILTLAQFKFYGGNFIGAKNLMEDGLLRDKDFNSLNGTTKLEKQEELDLFNDEILKLVIRDYNDILSFWFSSVGWNHSWSKENELIDTKTAAEAAESLDYMERIGTPPAQWLKDISGKVKESMKSSDNFFARIALRTGTKLNFETTQSYLQDTKDVNFVFIPKASVSPSTNAIGWKDDYSSTNEYILERSIIDELYSNGEINSNLHSFLTNKIDTLPDHIEDSKGKSYKILGVGPVIRDIKFDASQVIPVKGFGAFSTGLGFERYSLPMTFYNYNIVGENGLDSWSSVKNDFSPEEISLKFSSNKYKWLLGYDSPNMFTFAKKADSPIYNFFAVEYNGAALTRSDSDIYTMMNRENIKCMNDKIIIMQNSADAIEDYADNHESGILTEPLLFEKQLQYDNFINQVDFLTREIGEAQAEIDSRNNNTLGYHSVNLEHRIVFDQVFNSRLKASILKFNLLLSDGITKTGNGFWPNLDPLTLKPNGPEGFTASWTPVIEWDPTKKDGNEFDSEKLVSFPMKVSMNLPLKENGGIGVNAQVGLNVKNIFELAFKYQYSHSGKVTINNKEYKLYERSNYIIEAFGRW